MSTPYTKAEVRGMLTACLNTDSSAKSYGLKMYQVSGDIVIETATNQRFRIRLEEMQGAELRMRM